MLWQIQSRRVHLCADSASVLSLRSLQATCIGLFTLKIGHFRLKQLGRLSCKVWTLAICRCSVRVCRIKTGRTASQSSFSGGACPLPSAFSKAFSGSAISPLALIDLHHVSALETQQMIAFVQTSLWKWANVSLWEVLFGNPGFFGTFKLYVDSVSIV